jgi:hypothetical protein
MTRTALLIRCSAEEADRIRFEAQRERRTLSSYVLRISLNAVATDGRLFSQFTDRSQILHRQSVVLPGPRSAILVRCDVAEAERIREAAKRRDVRINAFILHALKTTWNLQMPLRVHAAKAPLAAAHQ